MYLLLYFTYQWTRYHIHSLIFFSVINNILMLVKKSNFPLVFFNSTCHANPGAVRKQAGSSSYISKHIFQKFSNASSNNNLLLSTYES